MWDPCSLWSPEISTATHVVLLPDSGERYALLSYLLVASLALRVVCQIVRVFARSQTKSCSQCMVPCSHVHVAVTPAQACARVFFLWDEAVEGLRRFRGFRLGRKGRTSRFQRTCESGRWHLMFPHLLAASWTRILILPS